MPETPLDALVPLLSEERLQRYRQLQDVDTMATYLWNIQLCEALYPSLCIVEVALRNTIHNTLAEHHGRQDWYKAAQLGRDDAATLRFAIQRVREAGKDPTSGRIVAGLSFGFWTGLLSSLYGNSPKGPRWWTSPHSPLLAAAFPYAPASIQQYRGRLQSRFNEIRRLRNRSFHYECIFDDPKLLQKHQHICEAIDWIHPELGVANRTIDRFMAVHSQGVDSIREIVAEPH